MRKPVTDLNLVFYDYAEKAAIVDRIQSLELPTNPNKLYGAAARRASYWPDGIPDSLKHPSDFGHNPRKLYKDYHDTEKD